MEITWLGHAGFLLATYGQQIAIDPYQNIPEGKVDIILITHAHYDHLNKQNIEALRADTTRIISLPDIAAQIGGEGILVGESKVVGDIKITAVEAYNVDKPNHPKGQGIGFLIEAEGKCIYHAGDTDLIPEMNMIECDVALLPVGGTYTMDAKEAASAAIILAPQQAIPMHWGSIVGHKEDADHFKEEIERESDIVVTVLDIGKKTALF